MPQEPRVPDEYWQEIRPLYLALFDPLREVAARQLGPDARLAPDIVHDAFEAAALAWKKVLRPRSDGGREAWLRTVVRNKIYDHWRADGSRLIPISTELAESMSAPQDTAMWALDRIDVEDCLKVVDAMPERQRRVAFLRWQGNWSTRKIAEHLGITETTVRVHVLHARLELRTLRNSSAQDDNPGDGRPR
jgi:RNA polymerase sigma factor (sigma-70 family)